MTIPAVISLILQAFKTGKGTVCSVIGLRSGWYGRWPSICPVCPDLIDRGELDPSSSRRRLFGVFMIER